MNFPYRILYIFQILLVIILYFRRDSQLDSFILKGIPISWIPIYQLDSFILKGISDRITYFYNEFPLQNPLYVQILLVRILYFRRDSQLDSFILKGIPISWIPIYQLDSFTLKGVSDTIFNFTRNLPDIILYLE